ncbi:MAG: hypothetical protein QM723_09265 [Myxococcaceae bacterium]
MTLALLAQAGPNDGALRSTEPENRVPMVEAAPAAPPTPSYSSMSREQLLRERARLLDARPSGAALPFAYIGTVLCLAGGVTSLVFLGHIGFQDLGPLLIIPTVVGFGLAALLILLHRHPHSAEEPPRQRDRRDRRPARSPAARAADVALAEEPGAADDLGALLEEGPTMTTLILLALLSQNPPERVPFHSTLPPAGAVDPDHPQSYSTMSREQLLHHRAQLLDDRPSMGAIVFAYIGTIICIAGAGASLTFAFIAGSADIALLLLIPTVVGLGLAALLIYYIATRTPLRRHIGNELDVIDDLLEHRDPALPIPLWPKNPVPMVTLAQF